MQRSDWSRSLYLVVDERGVASISGASPDRKALLPLRFAGRCGHGPVERATGGGSQAVAILLLKKTYQG